MALIFVDVEAEWGCPGPGLSCGGMTEFGAVEFQSVVNGTPITFHGKPRVDGWLTTFVAFDQWLKQWPGRPVFVSDNPAYDWQWINYWFHKTLRKNPFGHSARRIGDFYAGVVNNFHETQRWKRYRKTKHDHNPVNDALGNVEAFMHILELARGNRENGT